MNFIKRFSRVFIVAFSCFVIVFFASVAIAQTDPAVADPLGLNKVGENIALGGDDIRVVIARIIRAALGLVAIVLVVYILYAGFLIMTSQGEEDKIAQGRKTITNAVIGLAIIMSAMTIVQFLLSFFTGSGFFGGTPNSKKPEWQIYAGSGALGHVVKDHYPFRDQIDVARNAKIVVTFFEAIDPASLINNSNGTCWSNTEPSVAVMPDATGSNCQKVAGQNVEYFGDCYTPAGTAFDWSQCDTIKNSAVRIYRSADTTPVLLDSAVMASYEKVDNKNQAFTFVFRPKEVSGDWSLGENTAAISYTVDLTDNIKKEFDKKTSAFAGQFSNHYAWEFATGLNFDFTPPYVVGTNPGVDKVAPRNQIVQIYFSEPMDPTAVQGYLVNNGFSNLVFGMSVTGTWKITNGYKTAQFTPEEVCGQNSCGQDIYCLPIACSGVNCETPYSTLARTAQLANTVANSFEAIPFTGVMDLSGNALDDNDKNQIASPHKPGLPNLLRISGPGETAPDNFGWNFKIQNKIDLSLPYIENIAPLLDAESVAGKELVHLQFSRPLLFSSVDGKTMNIEEYPDLSKSNSTGKLVDQLGVAPISDLVNGKTSTTLRTSRPFGPNNTDEYYFPQIKTGIQSDNQQCFYPGFGPANISNDCQIVQTETGEITSATGCVPVNFEALTDTGCPTKNGGAVPAVASTTQECVNKLKENSLTNLPNL